MSVLRLSLALGLFALVGSRIPASETPDVVRNRVRVMRTPGGGIQPQAAVDSRGTVHLLSYQGDPAGGDLFYARMTPGAEAFFRPIRVNSQDGSAIAMGTIRGAQLALGKGGRVHVAWNGSGRGQTKNPNGGSPTLYARLDDAGTAFEPERNLMTRTSGLDGGGTVAADAEGRVYVAWHGRDRNAAEGEEGRRFFVSRSVDDGKTFAPERPALGEATGACGCCGSRVFVDRRGDVLALYRGAAGGIRRDLMLIGSTDRGEHFRVKSLHPWSVNMCPMSSETFAEGPAGVLAAWETEGRVYFTRISPDTLETTAPLSPPATRPVGRKHPAIAVNGRGEVILAWAEGTGWARDGALAWQVFDAEGRPTDQKGRISQGIPVWGLPTVVALKDGFVIVH